MSNKYAVGTKLLVISLNNTKLACSLAAKMKTGEEVEVEQELMPGIYRMSNTFCYHEDDLQLADVMDELASAEKTVEAVAPLTICDVYIGDELEIISVSDSVEEFDMTLQLGHIVEVVSRDYSDNSVQDADTGEWVLVSDLGVIGTTTATSVPASQEGLNTSQPEVEPEVEPEVNYLITKDSVTLTMNGDSETVTIDHKNFAVVRAAVLSGEYDEAMAMMNVAVGIANWGQGSLQIEGGKVLYVGMELTGKLIDRVISMMVDGDADFERFAKFLNLTMEQPSFKTRSRLMDFAAHDKLDINEDGYVVAFKNVNDSYYDKHSRTFRNMVGDSPSMRREDVNDDHSVSCSNGLHVCSPTYLRGFWGTSGRTMRVVVDPRDFVAIPYDYKDSKARVCKYTVVEDVTDSIDSYL